MHCINKSHPEYLNLLQKSNDHPHVLDAKISMWMDNNGGKAFPTIDEIEMLPSNKDIFFNRNSIKDLGTKYLANKDGFMPANINLADLQRDARKLNLSVHRSSRNTWFLRDNNNKFVNPSLFLQMTSQSSTLPYQDLKDKLFSWAKTHGISVITMEEMMNRVAETGPLEGSVAVADLLNKIIAIDLEKEMSDTLAEEVAHFATNILKDDVSVKKAMEIVENTDLYKEVKLAYADVYTTEEQFKKETVDKLLSEVILEQYEETPGNKTIMSYIKGIFSKFKKWLNKFKKSNAAEEIKRDLYPLAQSILNNELLGTVNTTDSTVYYQKKEIPFTPEKEEKIIEPIKDSVIKTKAKFAIKTANLLNERLDKLRTAKESVRSSIQDQIDDLKLKIGRQEFTASLLSIVEYAKEELVSAKEILATHDKNNTTNEDHHNRIRIFINMYSDLFRGFIADMHETGFSEKEKEENINILQSVQRELDSLGIQNESFTKRFLIEEYDAKNTRPDGTKIDSEFSGRQIIEKTYEDSGWWRFFAGNYKYAKSAIVRLVHKTIFDYIAKTKRFAVEKGNTLLDAALQMEKSGVTIDDLIEKVDGKFTQFLIRKENWGEYYIALNKRRQEVAEALGFENFSEIDINLLSKEDLKVYKQSMKAFYKQNTITIFDENGRFAGRKPKTLNPKFAELMQNQDVKNYYDLLIATKAEALAKLPQQYRTDAALYSTPGIRSQFLEKFSKNDQSIIQNVKEMAKESFFIDEDDTEFGEITALNNKIVPIYFTQRFENPANVSRDLTRSYTLFAEMAENFKNMSKAAPGLELLMDQIAKKEYVLKGKLTKGATTQDYKILETLIDANVYSIQKKDVSAKIPENALTKKLHLANKTFSFTKLAEKIASYISLNNLALNPYTSTAGLLKGSVDSILEDQIGLYTTVESKNWARAEYGKNILQVLSQVGNKKQTNKMHLMLQRYGVVQLDKMLRNTNRNKLLSMVTNRDLLFLNYQTADYAIKGRVGLAIYDNIRLVDGNFINRKNFLEKRKEEGIEEKTAKEEWKTYREKSLYNAYEVVGNSLKIKPEFKQYVTEGVENAAVGQVTHVANTVDGTMSDTDKGALAREVYGSFVLMHRGWFINMIDSRFMGWKGRKAKVNMVTGESEIGIYPAMMKFIYEDLFKNKNYLKWKTAYKETDPVIQRGVKKTLLDLFYLQIIAFLTAIANVAADDDDEENSMVQILAYQMNRVLLEQSASQPLLNPSEILQIIDEPVVGVRTIKDLLDISEVFNTDVYKSGMYKGRTHAKKFFMKKIPGFKNIYESQFPASKNNFLKNQIIDSGTYNLLKKNKDDDEFSIIDRLLLIFKNQEPKNESEVIQIIEALEGNEY
tara:strand:+ start:3964 stop:8052 length:4089 start_codon:yes stop_codon:yes gene_type:complete